MEDNRRGWVSLTLVVFVTCLQLIGVHSEPQVPCFFIFGDSLSDSGNNNNLATLAKANFPPFGIDHPNGTTGRFTNGKTIVDVIGDLLGLEGYIPPFASVKDQDMVKGVNYASGSAGIFPETGFQSGMRISMDQQLMNHKTVVTKLATSLGNDTAAHLSKCLYSVYAGSNDWMLNYLGGGGTIRGPPQAFADNLIAKLSTQLRTLHDLGARKVILFGMSPLGCLPILNVGGICLGPINAILDMYNTKLKSLTEAYNSNFTDSKAIWINTMAIVSPNNLSGLGLRVTSVPCCGSFTQVCLPFSVPCPDRTQYAYWDNGHPTEAANKVIGAKAFTTENQTHVYPMDISKLAKL